MRRRLHRCPTCNAALQVSAPLPGEPTVILDERCRRCGANVLDLSVPAEEGEGITQTVYRYLSHSGVGARLTALGLEGRL